MDKKWSTFIKISLSLALLIVVLAQINLADLGDTLRNANLGLFGLALLSYLVGVGIRAFRWQLLFQALGEQVSLWRLTELYLIGMFFNHFLPTGMGGDVVKIYEMSRQSRTPIAVSTTLTDRIVGILGSSLVALVALCFGPGEVPGILQQAVLVVSLCVILGTILLTQRRSLDVLIARVGLLQRLLNWPPLRQFYEAMTGYTLADLFKTVVVSLPFTITLILTQVFIARSLGVNLALGYFVLFVPLIALANVLPVSFNGLGVREGTYQLLFVPVGVAPAAAVAMSLAFHLVRLVTGLIGGVLYFFSSLRG